MNRPGDWNCRACHHLNFQRRESCQRCGELKPGGAPDYGGGFGVRGSSVGGGAAVFGFTGPDVRPGDWYCGIGNCGAHNFANRSSCFKCGAMKEEAPGNGRAGGGFDADFSRPRGFLFAGGSRSSWKSGDWICTRLGCNEHNFASRMECFRCNAPRESTGKSVF
ncbi:hypothetical protein M569_06829 [Genlisea aurea]|uniref:RanBP2-type domain-containing protein n=1 Tax=Genlisea aurea TaxID=192259 RepID=S8CMK1_9LAMI|nr:hypothetical protein M569_06829 [Genlisea aurea]